MDSLEGQVLGSPEFLHNPEFLMKHNHDLNEYVEYIEDDGNSITNLNKTNFRITVPASDDMVLMSDAFLQIRGQIVTNQPNPVVYTSGKVALVNNGWNLFDEAKYKINSRIIETVDHPGVVRQIKGLIEYSQDFSEGQGNQEMWYPDNGDGTLNGNIVVPVASVIAVTAAGENSEINTNGAGVLRLSVATTNNSAITLHLIDENGPTIIVFNETQGITVPLFVNGTNAQLNNLIDNNAGGAIAQDDVIRFYVSDFSRPLYLLDSNNNYITSLTVDGTPNLTLEDVLANRNIAILQSRQYLDDLVPFSSSFNTGYEKRRLKTVINGGYNTGQAFELFMPIRRVFKFMQTHPILLKGAAHILEFKRNSYQDMLLSEAITSLVPQQDPRVQLSYMSLWVPKIKLNLAMDKFYHENISDNAIAFSWDTYQYERSEPFTTGSGSWDVTTVSGIPKRMYVVFQRNDRLDNYEGNNMVFDHLDLQEVYVRLNSQRFPEYEYELNYGITGQEDNAMYMRAYNAYLNACMVSHSDSCVPAVSYKDFKNLYPIYCFDLRSKPEGVFKNASNIQIKVHWRLRGNAPPSYRITAVFEENVEIAIQFLSGSVAKFR